MEDHSPPPRHTKEQEGRVLGQGMMIAASVMLLLLFTFLFGFWEEHRRNPNRQPRFSIAADGAREVLLQRNAYGHYVGTGSINGKAANFLVDTGATTIAVPDKLAKDLGLTRGLAYTVETANGTAIAYFTKLASVRIGNIELFDVRASITPSMAGDEVLLGMSFLKELSFRQDNGELIIRQVSPE